jgi:hypothetical protein
MRVSQTRRSNAGQKTRSARGVGAGGGQFQLPKGRAAPHRPEISGPVAIGSVDALVALQAVEEPSDQRRQAVETGDRILDLLDQLKIGVLSGQVRAADLKTLKKTVERQLSVEDDPGLNDVLKQIDLRARVELAKLKGTAP